MARATLVVLAGVLLAGCGGAWDAGDGPDTRACTSVPGSATDLESEPSILREGDYGRWHDRDGCRVRLDVVRDYQGLGHCDWERVQFLETGAVIGEPIVRAAPEERSLRQFVRDPERRLADGFEVGAQLPADAADTGMRRGRWQLWEASGGGAVFLVAREQVERWPEIEPTGCA